MLILNYINSINGFLPAMKHFAFNSLFSAYMAYKMPGL